MDSVDGRPFAISNKGEFRFMDADSGNYQFEVKLFWKCCSNVLW